MLPSPGINTRSEESPSQKNLTAQLLILVLFFVCLASLPHLFGHRFFSPSHHQDRQNLNTHTSLLRRTDDDTFSSLSSPSLSFPSMHTCACVWANERLSYEVVLLLVIRSRPYLAHLSYHQSGQNFASFSLSCPLLLVRECRLVKLVHFRFWRSIVLYLDKSSMRLFSCFRFISFSRCFSSCPDFLVLCFKTVAPTSAFFPPLEPKSKRTSVRPCACGFVFFSRVVFLSSFAYHICPGDLQTLLVDVCCANRHRTITHTSSTHLHRLLSPSTVVDFLLLTTPGTCLFLWRHHFPHPSSMVAFLLSPSRYLIIFGFGLLSLLLFSLSTVNCCKCSMLSTLGPGLSGALLLRSFFLVLIRKEDNFSGNIFGPSGRGKQLFASQGSMSYFFHPLSFPLLDLFLVA